MSQTPPAISPPAGAAAAPAQKRPRDLRLDFFRGLAMFIILLAHVPGDFWALWIPARFGFSDATEIFVFCSGMASSLAFGAVYARAGFGLGTARIAFRVWQVYWAHVGVFLVTAALLFAIDHHGLGNREQPYIEGPWVVPLFERTGEALTGLLTLAYVPGLFDILPMYLVILAMIPAVMLAHRLGGRWAVFALVGGTWLAANLAGSARLAAEGSLDPAWATAAGAALAPLNLPAYPWGDLTWFFNPFGWQLVFFTGFCFGMGWLRPPPVRRWLVLLAAGYLLLVLPFAWHKLHEAGQYLPATGPFGLPLQDWVAETRAAIEPLWWKTWVGPGRFLHFLALAYLAWAAVGAGGRRLTEGFAAPGAPGRPVTALAGLAALAFLPHALVHEIHVHAPGIEAWLLRADWLGLTHVTADGLHLLADPALVGLWQLLFGVALALLGWKAIGARGRAWICREGFLATVPVIRKVGTQSLAVFMVSIPLSQAMGWALDHLGRNVWTVGAVNVAGFAILVGVAYLTGWMRRHPWREAMQPRGAQPGADGRPQAGGPALAAAGPGTGGNGRRAGQTVPAQRP